MSKSPQCQISSAVLALLREDGRTNGQFSMTKPTACLQICASKSQGTKIKRKTSTTVIVQNDLHSGVLLDTCLG